MDNLATKPTASGLLLLNKPSGPTSFECVRKARHILGEKRVGHCGTLDPLAEGVLVLLFGQHTRRQDEFLEMEKQYWFRSELGRLTDTGDRMGKTIQTYPVPDVTLENLQAVVRNFVGPQWQVPPKVSAIKYQGKRSYEWVRKGVEVPRPPRQIDIYSFEVLKLEGLFYEARVVCSRGTYIRSLVEDVAQKLGTGGVVDALIRERVGTYRREEGLTWDTLCASSREDLLKAAYA